jgi:hypothetical protein
MSFNLPLRFKSIVLALALFVLASSTFLRADTVVLKNGDKFSGTAVKLEGGKLTFQTAFADAIVIAWDQVTALTVGQPLILPTSKGNLSVTSIERTGDGLVVTTTSGPSTLTPADVTVLRSAADEAAFEASLHPSWSHAWTGAASVSLALARGNSDTTTFGAGVTAIRPTLTDKSSLYFNTLYSKNGNATPSTSANATAGGIRYEHNLNPKLFAFGTGDFYSNALQDLNLRAILGGGVGWHASKTANQTLDVLGGVVWTHESYSATASAPSTVNSFPALDLGETYNRKIGTGSLFTEQAYIYPDLSSLSKYQFTLNTGFSTKLGKTFSWVTNLSDNYTSFPPSGTKANDVVLTTGLGITLTRP